MTVTGTGVIFKVNLRNPGATGKEFRGRGGGGKSGLVDIVFYSFLCVFACVFACVAVFSVILIQYSLSAAFRIELELNENDNCSLLAAIIYNYLHTTIKNQCRRLGSTLVKAKAQLQLFHGTIFENTATEPLPSQAAGHSINAGAWGRPRLVKAKPLL